MEFFCLVFSPAVLTCASVQWFYVVAQSAVGILNMFSMYINVLWPATSCQSSITIFLSVAGVISPSFGPKTEQEYYSTFHNVRNRKKFTKKEWDNFTRESTQQAITEWAASPEFSDWMIENADRIQLLPSECSDETVGSGSDSTNENVVDSRGRFGFLNW